jgi:hypothetical protein
MLRAAVLIHGQLASRDRPVSSVSLPDYAWTVIRRLQGQIVRAARLGWDGAARRLGREMADAISRFQADLAATRHTFESQTAPSTIPSSSEIYRDLVALQAEFDQIEVHMEDHELVVTTECIVLDEIELGAFEIHLDWQRLDGSHPYRIVARDPNPAAQSTEIPHPHVQSETLCEGDGRAAIQAALAQGRLYDLFLLVSQVLHTYARGSAYAELDAWTGINCSDCGTTMSPDDSYGCQRCGSELCDDCRQLCAGCEESYCSGCLSQCPECEMDFCRGCLAACPGCKRKICGSCMENGLCPRCHEEQLQEEEENDDVNDHPNQPAAPHADGPTDAEKPAEEVGPAKYSATGEEGPDALAESHRLGETLVSA